MNRIYNKGYKPITVSVNEKAYSEFKTEIKKTGMRLGVVITAILENAFTDKELLLEIMKNKLIKKEN